MNHTEIYSLVCKMGELKPAAEDVARTETEYVEVCKAGFSPRLFQQTRDIYM